MKHHMKRDLAGLAHICIEKGYAHGWVFHTFHERFGFWPPDEEITPAPPTKTLLAFVRKKSRQYAKRAEKRERRNLLKSGGGKIEGVTSIHVIHSDWRDHMASITGRRP